MEFLLDGFRAVTWQQGVMYLVGFALIYLAIQKDYEPALLLPMGFGAILVSQVLHSSYVGPIAVAAYSYMALVPIIQPFAIKLVTTKKERRIRMPYNPKNVSRTLRICFPILVTIIAGFIAPMSVSCASAAALTVSPRRRRTRWRTSSRCCSASQSRSPCAPSSS